MLRKSTLLLGAVAVVTAATCHGAGPDDFKPEQIIALERAALDVWVKGDPQGYIQLYAPEVTYFDPSLKVRMDGRAALTKVMAASAGTFTIPRCEMVNPKVQRHGDIAVLTFNLINYGQTGQVLNRWNATEVYGRIGGNWKIIHSHWSFTAPELKQAGS